MLKSAKNLTRAAVSLFALGLLIIPSVKAASAAPSSTQLAPGITVTPAIAQINILQTETQHEVDFRVTNNSSSAQNLQLFTADFNALEDTGGLVFVGSNPTQLQKKYGLAQWISLAQTNVSIPAGQSSVLKAQILNLPTLAPGGHYGAIMLRLANNPGAGGKNVIGLKPIASILLFVNKVGGDIYHLKLAAVDTNRNLFKLPTAVNLRFYNGGNTHLTPRGVVTITDASGKLISKGIINQQSDVILPEVYRRFAVQLSNIASASRLGKYQLTVAFHFDGYNQFRLYQRDLFLVTPLLMIIILALVAIILILWRKRRLRHQLAGAASRLFQRAHRRR